MKQMNISSYRNKVFLRARKTLNKLGLRRKKIFVIGFNKSGTTSLHSFFLSLGLPSYHGLEWRNFGNSRLLHSYDCFSDGRPELKDLSKLDQTFPGSKYILQVRDLESWIHSRLSHVERRKKQGAYTEDPYFNDTYEAVKHSILKRNEYHLSVLSYFAERPADLLVINFIRDNDAATKVAHHIGVKGKYERPRKNESPSRGPSRAAVEILERCIRDLGITEQERNYDIYCPSLLPGDPEHPPVPPDTAFLTDPRNGRI